MAIRRGHLPADNFVMVPNAWARDESLSWPARGMLTYLLSHRPGWETSVAQLVHKGPAGRDAVMVILQDLEAHGYLKRTQQRGERGRLGSTDYDVVDPAGTSSPQSDSPSTVGPTTVGPTTVDPHPKKTSSSEDHEEKKTIKTSSSAGAAVASDQDAFDEWWAAYPRKVGKGSARTAYARAAKKIDHEQLLAALKAYLFPTDVKFVPHPSRWLNDERWSDVLPNQTAPGWPGRVQQPTAVAYKPDGTINRDPWRR